MSDGSVNFGTHMPKQIAKGFAQKDVKFGALMHKQIAEGLKDKVKLSFMGFETDPLAPIKDAINKAINFVLGK